MKLTFVNLYSPETVAKYLLSAYVLKAYLTKVFRNPEDLSIRILNFSCTADIEQIIEAVLAEESDCVGYSCYTWNIEKISDIIRLLKKRIQCTHVLGGPEITLSWLRTQPDQALANYYVLGAGERILARLINILDSQGTEEKIPPRGVAYLKNGTMQYEESTEGFENLDEIPSVYLTGTLEEELYERQQAYLETTRGCTFKCNYCMYHKNLSSISYYSLKRVFDELDYLICQKEVWQLRIFDSDFACDIQRAKKIVRHLVELKARQNVFMPWIYWEFTYYRIDEEFIELTAQLKNHNSILNSSLLKPADRLQHYSDMVKDYMVINCIGVQSFSKDALRAVNRPRINIRKFIAFMEMCKRHNVVLKIDFILGLPMETFESYFSGLETFLPHLHNTDHVLNIHRLQILPGCQLEQLCALYQIEYSQTAPHMVFSTQTMSRKQMQLASKLTAVLFRLINSPLRRYVYTAKQRSGLTFHALLLLVFNAVQQESSMQNTPLITESFTDDMYWNSGVFKDLPSQFLLNVLEEL